MRAPLARYSFPLQCQLESVSWRLNVMPATGVAQPKLMMELMPLTLLPAVNLLSTIERCSENSVQMGKI